MMNIYLLNAGRENFRNVNTTQNKRSQTEWVNAYLEEIKYK